METTPVSAAIGGSEIVWNFLDAGESVVILCPRAGVGTKLIII
jgi:hypothetical protein